MAVLEKYTNAAEGVLGMETFLSEVDFTDYTSDAFEFEKSELNKVWTKYKKLYEEWSSGTIGDKKDLVTVQAKHPQIRKAYIRCINILSKARKQMPEEVSNAVVPNQGNFLPLPQVDTGIFYGDYLSWPTFRDLFTAIIINSPRLSQVEKLSYLFQKTAGEAREINQNIAITAENFEVAWNNLKSNYENERVLVTNQLTFLFNMAPCQDDTAQEVKRLQRDINNCMSVLKLYEYNIDSWDAIFIIQCSTRLAPPTLQLWEQSVKSKTKMPKWEELNAFLTDRYHTLESINGISKNSQWSSSSQSGFQAGSHSNTHTNMKHKQVKTHHTKVDKLYCQICKNAHAISSCHKFLNMDYKNRVSILKKFRYCFNCLTIGHMYGDCTVQNSCSKCKKKHHTLMHRDFNERPKQQNQSANGSQNVSQANLSNQIQSASGPSTSRAAQSHHTRVSKEVMLATAWVNIRSGGLTERVRVLIDPCSDESFVTDRIQRLLKLTTEPLKAAVTGLGEEFVGFSEKVAKFEIVSLFNADFVINMEALVVSKITGSIPTHSFSPKTNAELPKLNFADPEFYKSGQVDLLLGGELYPSILLKGVQHGVLGTLVAQNTVFGWVVTGPAPDNTPSSSVRMSFMTNVSIDDQLSKFWELEEVSQRQILSEEDKICEEIYRSTTVRNSDGRYVVCLPFKDNCPSLGPNRHIAVSQFLRNEKSLLRKPEYKIMYDEVIKEYLALGHMEEIAQNSSGPSYYLPHHGVFKPDSTTTKLRVVFNASSASSNGESLNDMLHVGPVLQSDLVSLILKWRFFEFVFNADISKMYRQILVSPEHVPFQRIVFRDSEKDELQDFQLKTVTFGVNCAPYLALRTLLQLADDEEQRFPFGAKILRESMYVDDALVGAHSVSDAIVARDQLIGILKTAGFELRKWTSNSKHILENLPLDHLLSSSFLCLDDKSTAKTLGVRWNAASDHFYFVTEKIQLKELYTKREVLSIIARLFDPAGWLAPVIITAKILMQQMWLDKIGWDDAIKPVALHKWQSFVSKYNDVDTINIPRWIRYSPNCNIEFHGFCDSSEMAYAATLYVRVQLDDQVVSNLLIAKTKVAPVKKPSLPRLELCGAVLLANLVDSVMPQFKLKTYTLYLWSDSTIVLAWLRKPPCSWKTFVANRVATILEKVGNKNWFHVASNYNPADLATRGMVPSDLKESSLWWHGPEWLIQEKSSWPINTVEFETLVESKGPQVHVARSSDIEDILSRFSCLSRATHVIAYMFRFINTASKKRRTEVSHKTLNISAQELTFVRNRLFLLSQQIHFPNELSCLAKNEKIPSRSNLLTLTPFLDKSGVIRANGRLGASLSLSYHERHPIILAYNSTLARLYVEFIHKLVLHGGPRLVLNTIRQECWILKAKNLVKTVIHNCKTCVLYRKKLQGQIMAPLPAERSTFSRPFTNTGVDFAGPFEIKSFTGRYSRITKGYVSLFVCFSTKAIHLEAVSDLSSDAFMAALARFISRRGCPNKMFSDNGRNFVGAARKIDENFAKHVKEMRDNVVSKYGHQQLSWHFIPAGAPHMGGLWEAGVKSFKTHFKKVSGQIKYTFEEFCTLLATIEACLNSRPLGPLSENADEASALTPGHFLVGSALLSPAEPAETQSADSIVNRWRKVKAMQHDFCRRWKEEYLKELHKRNKWKFPQANVKENDLVAVRDEPVCPNEWRLGRILEVRPGPDSRVRVADIKTQKGTMTRPIQKLVLLPNNSL